MAPTDAFMLTVTAFVLANCISYFVRSSAPYVTGWGSRPDVNGLYEAVGFPFILYDLCIGGFVPEFRCPWINWIGNLAVAIAAGCLSATCLAHRLPSVWPGWSRAFRISWRVSLGVVALATVLLGLAAISRGCGLFVRNLMCFAGPVCVVAWSLYRRRASWIYLTVAAVGLTLLTLAVDVRYQEPSIDPHKVLKVFLPGPEPNWRSDVAEWSEAAECAFTRRLIGLTFIRAAVPIFGLLSLLTIASAAYSILRQYYPLWTRRNAELPAASERVPAGNDY